MEHPDFFEVHKLFSMEDLFDAKVHLGHHEGCWHPLMKRYLYGAREHHHIIDLNRTVEHLRVSKYCAIDSNNFIVPSATLLTFYGDLYINLLIATNDNLTQLLCRMEGESLQTIFHMLPILGLLFCIFWLVWGINVLGF